MRFSSRTRAVQYRTYALLRQSDGRACEHCNISSILGRNAALPQSSPEAQLKFSKPNLYVPTASCGAAAGGEGHSAVCSARCEYSRDPDVTVTVEYTDTMSEGRALAYLKPGVPSLTAEGPKMSEATLVMSDTMSPTEKDEHGYSYGMTAQSAMVRTLISFRSILYRGG